MELFKNTNYDFLGKKWPFIIVSVALLAISIGSFLTKGLDYGIDFRGGALMTVQFASTPPVEKLRAAMNSRVPGDVTVQSFTGTGARNQVEIGTQLQDERQLNQNRAAMEEVLRSTFGRADETKPDLNSIGVGQLTAQLRDALATANVALNDDQIQQLAAAIKNDIAQNHSGLITDFRQLADAPGVTGPVLQVLQQRFSLAPYVVIRTEVVGPKVGSELQRKAIMATLYALAGMLLYVAFRFEWVYGVGAVLAVLHDTVITLGLFSIFDKEISMTVIAALLTLVGYSMNDTIVIFDRMRENLRFGSRMPLEAMMNHSINQTLGRTVMTSGLTLLSAVALLIWGGPVLHGFSFALVCGIVVGSYSTMFIASPIVLLWRNYFDSRRTGAPAATAVRATAGKAPTKAVK